MGYNQPWIKLNEQVSSLNLKTTRVSENHPFDFFWGVDSQGKYLLVLKLSNIIEEFLQKGNISLSGVSGDFREIDGSEYMLVLTLEDKSQSDIFYKLCTDLVESSANCKDESVAASVIINRIKRWQAFLKHKRYGLLSRESIQGLFAELVMLEELLTQYEIDEQDVLRGWLGPKGASQDFVIGGCAVEVKSILTSKNSVRISSENQLSTHLESLYLRIYYMIEDSVFGVSLNEQVSRVKGIIKNKDISLLSDLEDLLISAGYIDLHEYDNIKFQVNKTVDYLVTDSFPCLNPSSTPLGVKNVSYDLDLNALDAYKRDLTIKIEGA